MVGRLAQRSGRGARYGRGRRRVDRRYARRRSARKVGLDDDVGPHAIGDAVDQAGVDRPRRLAVEDAERDRQQQEQRDELAARGSASHLDESRVQRRRPAAAAHRRQPTNRRRQEAQQRQSAAQDERDRQPEQERVERRRAPLYRGYRRHGAVAREAQIPVGGDRQQDGVQVVAVPERRARLATGVRGLALDDRPARRDRRRHGGEHEQHRTGRGEQPRAQRQLHRQRRAVDEDQEAVRGPDHRRDEQSHRRPGRQRHHPQRHRLPEVDADDLLATGAAGLRNVAMASRSDSTSRRATR